jgi:hypothetical protein
LTATAWSDGSRADAEPQLAASAARHREVVASMQQLGRPDAGQHVAVKSVGSSRSVSAATDAGVPFERLVELTGWEPDLVREGLKRVPEPRVIARLAPAGVDPDLTVEAPSALAPADLEDLHDRLQTAWSAWRQALGREET